MSILTLIIASVILVLCMQYYFIGEKEYIINRMKSNEKLNYVWIKIIVLAVALRLFLFAATGGYDTDIGCWLGWGNYIATNGPETFYTAIGHEWYDYPPLYMLVLGAIGKVLDLFGITYGTWFYSFGFILPPIIADVINGCLIKKYAFQHGSSVEESIFIGLLFLFNPVVFYTSGGWGQIDSILTLFLILTFIAVDNDKPWLVGLFYGLAISTKWQALIYGPVLVFVVLTSKIKWKKIFQYLGAACESLLILFVLSLPFKGSQDLFWIIDKFASSSSGYNYATVEAYNFMAMFGANWVNADNEFMFGLTYKTFGTIAIVFSIVLSLILSLKYKKREAIWYIAGLYMFIIFTFGHYMHERYIYPVIPFILFSYARSKEKKRFLSIIPVSVTTFFNELYSQYIVSETAISTVRYSNSHKIVANIGGILEVVALIVFLYYQRPIKQKGMKE